MSGSGPPGPPGTRGRRSLFTDPSEFAAAGLPDPGTGAPDPDTGAPDRDTGAPDRDTGAPERAARAGPRRGRRALFSDDPLDVAPPAPAAPPPGQALTKVGFQCRTCLARTRVSWWALPGVVLPSLWLPGRPWPLLVRCPSCRRVAWCRVSWPARS